MCPTDENDSLEFVTVESHARRAVAFFVTRKTQITARNFFRTLNPKVADLLRTRFEYWVSGKPIKKYFHGWDRSQFAGKYTFCFVFKCNEKRIQHRFYGFLCNPKDSNPGYQICILVVHATKREWDTDEHDLRQVEAIRTTPTVQEIILNHFKKGN